MTGDDLIVTAPWLVFGAGLAIIGYRLLAHRGTRRRPLRHRRAGPAPGTNVLAGRSESPSDPLGR